MDQKPSSNTTQNQLAKGAKAHKVYLLVWEALFLIWDKL